MKKNSKSNGPGRPKYTPTLPKGKFTFTDLEIANGVNPKTGKGKDCTTLTLRKWLKRELAKRGHSAIVHLKDTFADPTSKHGLGRKQYVYQRRAGVSVKASAPAPKAAPAKATKAPKATRKPRTVKVKVDKGDIVSIPSDAVSQSTADYEATKAALLAPVMSIAPAPMPVAPPSLVDRTDTAPAPEAEQAPVPVAAEDQTSPEEITAETIEPEVGPEPTITMEEADEPEGQPIPVPAPALVG